jgi:hypothetical protein
VHGDGPWALLAHCRDLSISLWDDPAEARDAKREVDRFACGGRCTRRHEIIDLRDFR